MSPETTAVTGSPEATQQIIQASTMILQFSTGSIGSRKKVRSDEVEVDADPKLLRVSKEIMASDRLKAINRFVGDVRDHVRELSLPSLLRSGLYQIPVSLIEEIDSYLTKSKRTWIELIESFLSDYEDETESGLKARAKSKLRALYDEGEYPSSEAIRSRFSWEVRYMTFQTPKRLQSISQAMYEREKEKAAALALKQQEEITFLLRSQMLDLVAHMHDRLRPDPESGKRKVFRETLTDGIMEFFEHFNDRNIFRDEELSALVERAKEALGPYDASILRDNEVLRERIAEEFGKIRESLDEMVINAPLRSISFDDEE